MTQSVQITPFACLLEQIRSLSPSDKTAVLRELSGSSTLHLDDDVLVDEHVASSELGIAPATLRVWRCTGRHHLPYAKVGRLVKYRMGDLRNFKQSCRVDTRVPKAAK